MNLSQLRPFRVLLVEDSAADARLVAEALHDSGVPIKLRVASDGVEAMAYLRREGPHASASPPDLVLLDLNMPRKDGREVLAEIKADVQLRRIPVVIFTTSDADRDVAICYDLQANCYTIKSMDLEEFMRVVGRIVDFWSTTARLPSSVGQEAALAAAEGSESPRVKVVRSGLVEVPE